MLIHLNLKTGRNVKVISVLNLSPPPSHGGFRPLTLLSCVDVIIERLPATVSVFLFRIFHQIIKKCHCFYLTIKQLQWVSWSQKQNFLCFETWNVKWYCHIAVDKLYLPSFALIKTLPLLTRKCLFSVWNIWYLCKMLLQTRWYYLVFHNLISIQHPTWNYN